MKPTTLIKGTKTSRLTEPRVTDAMMEAQAGWQVNARPASIESEIDAASIAEVQMNRTSVQDSDEVLAQSDDANAPKQDAVASEGGLPTARSAAANADADIQLADAGDINSAFPKDDAADSVAAKSLGMDGWGVNPLSMMLAQAETGMAAATASGGTAAASAAAAASSGALMPAVLAGAVGVGVGAAVSNSGSDSGSGAGEGGGNAEQVVLDFAHAEPADWNAFLTDTNDADTTATFAESRLPWLQAQGRTIQSLQTFDANKSYDVTLKFDSTSTNVDFTDLFGWDGWENLGADDKITFVDSSNLNQTYEGFRGMVNYRYGGEDAKSAEFKMYTQAQALTFARFHVGGYTSTGEAYARFGPNQGNLGSSWLYDSEVFGTTGVTIDAYKADLRDFFASVAQGLQQISWDQQVMPVPA